jgi:hypothetical protein
MGEYLRKAREVESMIGRTRWVVMILAAFGSLCAQILAAGAGEADVVSAMAARATDGAWRFEVTVRHGDEGWDHYADAFDVLGPDSAVLGIRTLVHPHDMEQPFTRSLSGVQIPAGITTVLIRAHDSVHGHGGATVLLTLPQ